MIRCTLHPSPVQERGTTPVDDLLKRYVQCPDADRAEALLVELITGHAQPGVRKVVRDVPRQDRRPAAVSVPRIAHVNPEPATGAIDPQAGAGAAGNHLLFAVLMAKAGALDARRGRSIGGDHERKPGAAASGEPESDSRTVDLPVARGM